MGIKNCIHRTVSFIYVYPYRDTLKHLLNGILEVAVHIKSILQSSGVEFLAS